MAVDWTQLPPELLETISKSLKIYADFTNCRAVCHNWRSSIPETPYHLPPQLPWLMLAQSQTNRSHIFFNLSVNEFYLLSIPEASNRNRLCGSSHGWLIILDDSPTILLLNPISRSVLSLPPLSSFPGVISFNYADVGREYALRNVSGDRLTYSLRKMRDCFIKKVVLSSSPSKDGDFIAMAILNQIGDLAYCRNGDQCWTVIEDARSYSEDVIYSNGSFLAVNKVGQIAVCDINCDTSKVSFIKTPSQIGGDIQYLVSCGDELLLVTRYVDGYFEVDITDDQQLLVYRTTRFEVFRLDWNETRWIKVQSLGDYSLFIGQNSSLSILSTDFPGCAGNCIYFTDEYSDTNYDGYFSAYDLGIFKLLDESIEPLSCYSSTLNSGFQMPPPIWVSPNPF